MYVYWAGGTDHTLNHTVTKQNLTKTGCQVVWSLKISEWYHVITQFVWCKWPAVLIKPKSFHTNQISSVSSVCISDHLSLCYTSWLVLLFSSVSLAVGSAGPTRRSCVALSFCESAWPFLFCVFFGAPALSPFARFCRKLASCAGRTVRGRWTHRSRPLSTTTLSAWWSSGVKGEGVLESRFISSLIKKEVIKT